MNSQFVKRPTPRKLKSSETVNDLLSALYQQSHLYINGLCINLYINLYIKHLRLHNNFYIKKKRVFLLRNDDSYFIYTFQIKLNLI